MIGAENLSGTLSLAPLAECALKAAKDCDKVSRIASYFKTSVVICSLKSVHVLFTAMCVDKLMFIEVLYSGSGKCCSGSRQPG